MRPSRWWIGAALGGALACGGGTSKPPKHLPAPEYVTVSPPVTPTTPSDEVDIFSDEGFEDDPEYDVPEGDQDKADPPRPLPEESPPPAENTKKVPKAHKSPSAHPGETNPPSLAPLPDVTLPGEALPIERPSPSPLPSP